MRKAGRGHVSVPGFPVEKIAAAHLRGRTTSTVRTAIVIHDRQGGIYLSFLPCLVEKCGVATINGSSEGKVPWLR